MIDLREGRAREKEEGRGENVGRWFERGASVDRAERMPGGESIARIILPQGFWETKAKKRTWSNVFWLITPDDNSLPIYLRSDEPSHDPHPSIRASSILSMPPPIGIIAGMEAELLIKSSICRSGSLEILCFVFYDCWEFFFLLKKIVQTRVIVVLNYDDLVEREIKRMTLWKKFSTWAMFSFYLD